jgi:hypothetical protein
MPPVELSGKTVRSFRLLDGLSEYDIARLRAAPTHLPEALSQIRELMLLGDPIALYGQLHWFDALRRSNTTAAEHYGSDALNEFFGGLVLSLR